MDKLWYEINILFFSKEKRGYNKGKVSQSNESKNTVDGNYMTKKLLIVMFSTNPAIGEQRGSSKSAHAWIWIIFCMLNTYGITTTK